ncbi:unnamed protein product, partial [Laminaria digitata]
MISVGEGLPMPSPFDSSSEGFPRATEARAGAGPGAGERGRFAASSGPPGRTPPPDSLASASAIGSLQEVGRGGGRSLLRPSNGLDNDDDSLGVGVGVGVGAGIGV